MKKKNVLNLIKYHAENNDNAFKNEAFEIARYFDQRGDYQLAEYIMAMMSEANTFMPQISEDDVSFFRKIDLDNVPLPLPEKIKEDVIGIINAIGRKAGINKFLFEGAPGTGKTETAKQIARILERDLYMVEFESVIDSKLGQTSKNISLLFKEIHSLRAPEKAIILFDEIDVIALDRINSNDLREMGRATSSILRELDHLDENVVLIATTNLFSGFDKALIRRFDAVINFNRYSKEELVEISEAILNDQLNKFEFAGRNMRLFKKIISQMEPVPFPGELKNLIKTSLAFSNPNDEYDYMKRLYYAINGERAINNLKGLYKQGFTVREIEILTGISKSQVSRELKEGS